MNNSRNGSTNSSRLRNAIALSLDNASTRAPWRNFLPGSAEAPIELLSNENDMPGRQGPKRKRSAYGSNNNQLPIAKSVRFGDPGAGPSSRRGANNAGRGNSGSNDNQRPIAQAFQPRGRNNARGRTSGANNDRGNSNAYRNLQVQSEDSGFSHGTNSDGGWSIDSRIINDEETPSTWRGLRALYGEVPHTVGVNENLERKMERDRQELQNSRLRVIEQLRNNFRSGRVDAEEVAARMNPLILLNEATYRPYLQDILAASGFGTHYDLNADPEDLGNEAQEAREARANALRRTINRNRKGKGKAN